jgi:hypothetical protein
VWGCIGWAVKEGEMDFGENERLGRYQVSF